ncbi:MAG TPA: SulP family inorganic anion transporter [Actinomycetota bacterium]|nr:SulP family inorganic anion transporter [Actinomycetota bacterium]
MAEREGTGSWLGVLLAGGVIGIVEVVLAISFAALVFGGYLYGFLAQGIGIFLLAAAIAGFVTSWRGGGRGLVGSLQDAAAAVIAVVGTNTAVNTFGSLQRSFLTAIAATVVVTMLTGITFLVLGTFRLGNLVRFVPYPVVGGFLAGTGWLLLKGGIYVASGLFVTVHQFSLLVSSFELVRWLPGLGFGVAMYLLVRFVRAPFMIPLAIVGAGVLFVIGMVVTGSTLDSARDGNWLLGPFPNGDMLQVWTLQALPNADWLEVARQVPGIATAVFVAVVACLFNLGAIELVLEKDLEGNRELRDAGIVNVLVSLVAGIPAYPAISLTSLAHRMRASGRAAGFVAALVPLVLLAFGTTLLADVPRMIVGGVLVFLGLAFLVEWVIDKRRSLPALEYLVVLVILVTIAWRGLLPGVVMGLVLALFLFAVDYGRVELVNEVEFGDAYHSNVDRPGPERAILRARGGRVMILRIHGFVFFGMASGLLERIRKRVEAGGLRFLLIDLRRVTGVDSSAVLSFLKATHLARDQGFELVLTGVSDGVEQQLARGGVASAEGVVSFEVDLDRGLQRCEDGLLRDGAVVDAERRVSATAELAPDGDGGNGGEVMAGLPSALLPHLERREIPEGTVLIHQHDPPGDLYVLDRGRLRIETVTAQGNRMRLRTLRPGVVVGEMALYTGVGRSADVVAETPCVVLLLSRDTISRIEAEEPELASALHRWLATTLAERLGDTLRAFDALLD